MHALEVTELLRTSAGSLPAFLSALTDHFICPYELLPAHSQATRLMLQQKHFLLQQLCGYAPAAAGHVHEPEACT